MASEGAIQCMGLPYVVVQREVADGARTWLFAWLRWKEWLDSTVASVAWSRPGRKCRMNRVGQDGIQHVASALVVDVMLGERCSYFPLVQCDCEQRSGEWQMGRVEKQLSSNVRNKVCFGTVISPIISIRK